jgi:hypothetical protein
MKELEDRDHFVKKLALLLTNNVVWLPEFVLLTLAFAFDITVHFYELAEHVVNAARTVERPHTEYIGTKREVHVLIAELGYHSMLPQSDAARIGFPGTAVTVDGEKLHCCVAASWQRLVWTSRMVSFAAAADLGGYAQT